MYNIYRLAIIDILAYALHNLKINCGVRAVVGDVYEVLLRAELF